MNFMQLTVFREVMESGSISQTAKKLGRTQPAISLAIQNLERSLDLTLFERRGRRLIPVPEAQYLMGEASEILDRLTKVSGTMTDLRSAQTGSLNVVAMPGPSAFLFPRFISENVIDDANFQTTISSASSAQIRELASTQSIDFGFADFEEPAGRATQYLADIVSADCFCAVSRNNPLADQKTITIADLDGISIATLHGDHPLPRRLPDAFARDGATYKSNIAGQFFLPLLPFIALGQCCSIVDPLTVVTAREMNITQDQVVFVPFDAPVRYEYATLSPAYRPLSRLAARLKDEWMQEVINMLQVVGAQPSELASLPAIKQRP